jgi:histone acetyltransferase 1
MSKEDTRPGADANLPSDEEEASSDEDTTPKGKEEDSDYLLTDEEEAEETTTPLDEDANGATGTTRTRRMPVDEIIERCYKALPTMVQDLKDDDDFLKEPIGTILHEYQRNKLQFVISLADGRCNHAVQLYHTSVQTLATWFIETADSVNVASQDGGYWKVLYLFRRDDALHQYSLAGYLTVFHFLSPFKKPKSGIVARVCQALILPPYQRMGHGKMLLKSVHELATIPVNNIVEVNVEDPAPAFVALRDCVDYELFQESLSTKTNPWLNSIYTTMKNHEHVHDDPDFFRGVSDKDAIAAGAVARITPRQVQICHELYKLSLVLGNDEEELSSKQYRIMVKKRLAKVHREELGACRTKEQKQAWLGKMFDETLKHYKSVLKRK